MDFYMHDNGQAVASPPRMANNSDPLALHASQYQGVEMGGRLRLNNRQIAYLQNFGLLAEPSDTYHHPAGAFALMPLHPDTRKSNGRKRVNLTPVRSL